MEELFEKHPWIESAMLAISQEVVKTVPRGLMFRVCLGASLSVLALAADAVVILGYLKKEETRVYGHALLAMIAASMTGQLLLVCIQNRRKPRELSMEMLKVLTGLKPVFDACAVSSGMKIEDHQMFDAKTELSIAKGIETVAENIGGCVLKTYVILRGSDRSGMAVASVLISALASGWASATLSYDFDTDPVRRKESPAFYGYVPDKKISRTKLLMCMALNSASLLLARSLSMSLLLLVKKIYFLMYMSGDMALYLLYKVAREDFHYWMPVDGVAGLLVSLLMRVGVKLVSDFTGLIHCRCPQEVGGLYWTVNMFLALLASFASAFVYHADTGEELELAAAEIEERAAWTLVGSLSGVWVRARFGY